MKVEQACRFRLDEGYSVFAKSPGLTPAQETSLGNIFNSAMNNIFPQIGDSILSCTTDNTDVFLARNTLRTDIHGRKTMFTHAYVFSADEYARLMREDPMAVLGVEMSTMLETQSPGAQMPTMELTATASAAPIEALFEKYNLTATRYSRLLLGAYLALTSDRSLQLVTGLPLDQTAPMVRELTLCILEGLLPVLKGKLSFSTGPDTRMKISVVCTGSTSAPSGELLFGVEDDRYTNIRPRDEVTELAFNTLAAADHAERRNSVAQMQNWLENAVNLQEGLSVTLIATAYCLSANMNLDTDTLLKLFRGITGAKGISSNVANTLLASLVRRMNEGSGCTQNALSLIAAWYLRGSNAAFREEADKALSVAPVEICVALADAAFKQEMSDKVSLFLKTLLRRIPTDSPSLSGELKTKMVLWILSENETEFIDYATVLMVDYRDSQLLELAKGILAGCRKRPLSEAEDAMLAKALRHLADSHNRLPEDYVVILDAHSAAFSPKLNEAALDYLFRVRLADLTPENGLALVDKLAAEQPTFFAWVIADMAKGAATPVWELYQTRDCFRNDPDVYELANILRQENTFGNPCGPFEQRAAQRLLTMVRADFAAYPEEKVQMSYYSDPIAKRWFRNTEQMNLSAEMKAEIFTGIALIFWEAVTPELIYQNKQPISQQLAVELPETEEKLLLTCLCLELREDVTNASRIVRMITDPETDEKRRKLLCECAGRMVFALLNDHRFLSWDLVLGSCWQPDEKESGPDPKQLQELCERLDHFFRKQNKTCEMDADCSVLLRDDKLRKSLCRMNIPSETFQQLQEQIKPERGGLLGLFKGHGDKKAESQRHVFDPMDLDNAGKKGKKNR